MEGAVSGVGYVGGVVGYAQYSTILNCGSRVEVTGAAYVGGVVGYLVGGAIYNSYNTGQVRVTSSSYGGGFIGCVESSAAVVCCYSAGAVIGYSPATSGGFVGYNSGSSIAYSFWASDVSGTANVTAAYNGYGDVSTLYAYSYALMRVAGFVTILNDFNRSDEWTAWRADSQLVNEGYPIL